MDRFELVSGDLKFKNIVRSELSLLDEAVAGDHDKKLPLAVVPVLPLGNARLRDIHGELPAACGLEQLREAAPLIRMHLQRNRDALLRQIG